MPSPEGGTGLFERRHLFSQFQRERCLSDVTGTEQSYGGATDDLQGCEVRSAGRKTPSGPVAADPSQRAFDQKLGEIPPPIEHGK